MTDKELGLLLINAGYLTQEDILVSLQQYFIDVVRRLFTWVEGLFRFEQDGLELSGRWQNYGQGRPGKPDYRRLAPAARVGTASRKKSPAWKWRSSSPTGRARI
jgi:hypothetical protein